MENKEFYRRTVKVGNSAGVLLPKSLLGAEVKVSVINMPHNLKKDALRILEPILENIIGIYIIKQEFESNKESSKKQEKSEKNRNKKTKTGFVNRF